MKKTYEVVSMERLGTREVVDCWKYSNTVTAYDHEDAAEVWAEEDDQMGDYSIIRDGSHGPVRVRLLGDDSYKTFTISAYSDPTYSARECKD